MKILFLIPPTELNDKKSGVDRVYGCNYGFDYKPPIHLLVLATIAKQLGHNIRLLDCPAERYNLKRFKDYIKKQDSVDMVVFFSVWLSKNGDLLAADIIRNIFNKAKVIFTGPYPTWKPELFSKNNDYIIIRGEPESAFADVMKKIEGKEDNLSEVKGISFSNGGCVINNASQELIDLNTIPIPDRSMLSKNYRFNRIDEYPATIMCVSRGCSYGCSYCAPHALDQAIELEFARSHQGKPPLRIRGTKEIIDEFKQIALLGYKGIEICDNQFTWDKASTMEICNAIRNLQLSWICYGRADHLQDKEMLKAMHNAGCRLIYIGTESFCQEILDDINKGMSAEDIFRAIRLLKECGIKPEVSILLGASALETEKTIMHSLKAAKRLKTNFIHYSIASPLPNTSLYRVAKERNWIKGGEFVPVDNVRDALIDLPEISAKRLKAIIRKCYARQYLSLRFIAQQITTPNFLKNSTLKFRALAKLLNYVIFNR